MRTAPDHADASGPKHFYALSGPYDDLKDKVRANQRRYYGGDGEPMVDVLLHGDSVAAITYSAFAEGQEASLALPWRVGAGWYVSPPIGKSTKNFPSAFQGGPSARRVVLGPDGLEATEVRVSIQFRDRTPDEVAVVCIESPKPACTRGFTTGTSSDDQRLKVQVSYPGDGRIVLSLSDEDTAWIEQNAPRITKLAGTFAPFGD